MGTLTMSDPSAAAETKNTTIDLSYYPWRSLIRSKPGEVTLFLVAVVTAYVIVFLKIVQAKNVYPYLSALLWISIAVIAWVIRLRGVSRTLFLEAFAHHNEYLFTHHGNVKDYIGSYFRIQDRSIVKTVSDVMVGTYKDRRVSFMEYSIMLPSPPGGVQVYYDQTVIEYVAPHPMPYFLILFPSTHNNDLLKTEGFLLDLILATSEASPTLTLLTK